MSDIQVKPFIQYLAAKKSIDDRSLHRGVWNALARQVAQHETSLRVLEVGSGIGTMITRAVEWRLFRSDVHYTAVDVQQENTAEAPHYLTDWATRYGVNVAVTAPSALNIEVEGNVLQVEFHTEDVFSFIANKIEPASYDLLIANAFIDLVHIPTALPVLFSALKPGGLFYFTIVFDGISAFEPPIDPEMDTRIEALYHADMETRRWNGQPTGGSQAGRRLLRYLLNADVELLCAGSSDWVVTPTSEGYHADEDVFLHAIIDTVHSALTGHPELDAGQFTGWINRRHRQIDEYKLAYIAHQLDLLGKI